MALTQRDTAHHTYGDYLAWADDVRYELIDGIAYLISPLPTRLHQEVVGELYRQTANALAGQTFRPYIAPFGERGMRGAPDWVVEVPSPASASHDQTVKLSAYERARVPGVWLVHPADCVVTVYRFDGTRYGRPAIYETKGELTVETLPGIRIR